MVRKTSFSPETLQTVELTCAAEVSNNNYKDGSSGLQNTEASFKKNGRGISFDQRKMNAVRAYFEWMPLR